MNLLEEIVFSLPQPWLDEAYDSNTDGMSTGYCGSLDVVAQYIKHLENTIKELENER